MECDSDLSAYLIWQACRDLDKGPDVSGDFQRILGHVAQQQQGLVVGAQLRQHRWVPHCLESRIVVAPVWVHDALQQQQQCRQAGTATAREASKEEGRLTSPAG